MTESNAVKLVEQLWEGDDPSPDLLRSILATGNDAIAPLRSLFQREIDSKENEEARITAACLLGFLGDQASISEIVGLFQATDINLTDLPYGIGHLGPEALDPLLDVIRDPEVPRLNRGLAMEAAANATLGDAASTNKLAGVLREMLQQLIDQAKSGRLGEDADYLAPELAYTLLRMRDPSDEVLLETAFDADLLIDSGYAREDIAERLYEPTITAKPDFEDWLAVYADRYELVSQFKNFQYPVEETERALAALSRGEEPGQPSDEITKKGIEALLEPYKGETFKRSTPKVGRNDPCWCGSGKKYKKCHLSIDESVTII